ncbi:DMT family transporter [Marivivens donghaensis]|jgi:drug/metabolite transporter (DMT)-like permease|uniref:DMT family transporter n=1 Tax=Marivivens donghaensis TaxID=1699413 RepID=UPI003F6953B1
MIYLIALGALFALAANSVLIRLAVVDYGADPAAFAVVRVATGAVVLMTIALLQKRGAWPTTARSFAGALCLAGYIIGFSLAYRTLDAGFGALLLFGWVQITIFATVVARGNRPSVFQWIGAIVAFFGLVWLLKPSSDLGALPVIDLMLMSFAGMSWGFYTLLGRGAGDPVRVNAMSFALCLLFVLPLMMVGNGALSGPALVLAMVSGGITSGLGYALWYRIVAVIDPALAGVGQLMVPVLASLGGLVWINEPITVQWLIGAALVLGGIGLSIAPQIIAKRRL